MKFAPLHIYSTYSFLKSGLTIERIAASVQSNDYFGVGLSDISIMHAIPKFVLAMEKIQKPFIIGMEIEFENNFLCLYVVNEKGYKSLSFISSSVNKNEFNREVLESHNEGLIAILDTHNGEINRLFVQDEIDENYRRYLAKLSKIFSIFYLGIEISSSIDKITAEKIRQFADKYNYPLVAFPKIKYQKKEDAIILKILDAIDNDLKLTIKEESGTEYFYSEKNYAKIYTKEEIDNTVKIVNSSSFDFHKKRGELIHYPCDDSKKYLKEVILESLKNKNLDNNPSYVKRMEYEYDIICQMGYEDYFLVVRDYVNYAKNNDILVGSGRGSAAGSLISYLCNITQIDPLKYGLQFERFLNPDRKTMPDIDIDFIDSRRDEVVDYVRQKYGNNKVANIVTFTTILAKQAIRDIGRIYEVRDFYIDKLSKAITNHNLSLREAYLTLPAFKNLVDSDKYYLEIVSLASKIEGLVRQTSVHAAGVVLNNSPIEDDMPISIDLNDNYISQYEMHYLEEQGFLKMDFLSLRNLSVISRCVDLINHKAGKIIIDKQNLPFDSEETYKLISSCKTMGIFQLESSGMKRAIRELKPTCFNDIVALLALFRPGPMQSIPTYAKRKEGKEKIPYVSKELEDVLKETYGIIVYQEQINQIATKMAGFTPGEADTFRRAISKKQADLLVSSENKFIEGALKKGYSKKEAKDVFDHILKFANYGFNKAHSVSYALIACQMAYLKTHYPLEFYASILEFSSSTNDEKFSEYVSEIKSRNIKLLPPSIHTSSLNFTIVEEGLLFPLGSIKGINEILVNKIIEERKEGKFIDFFDFVGRMHHLGLSESNLEKLIDAGALDCFSSSRQSMRKSIIHAFQTAKTLYNNNGQLTLNLGAEQRPMLQIDNDDPLENLDKEYQALGIMLSSNPLRYKKDLIESNGVTPIIEAINQNKFKVAGIIKTKKVIHTKKGTPMAFIKIFDETGEMEITIFPNLYSEVISLIEKNKIIIIEGRKDRKDGVENFLADQITLLEE